MVVQRLARLVSSNGRVVANDVPETTSAMDWNEALNMDGLWLWNQKKHMGI